MNEKRQISREVARQLFKEKESKTSVKSSVASYPDWMASSNSPKRSLEIETPEHLAELELADFARFVVLLRFLVSFGFSVLPVWVLAVGFSKGWSPSHLRKKILLIPRSFVGISQSRSPLVPRRGEGGKAQSERRVKRF